MLHSREIIITCQKDLNFLVKENQKSDRANSPL
jgi:hypothetical protein